MKREFGSYSSEDVIFLLKDISNLIIEKDNNERENLIQRGMHYSEMIPKEYEVSDKYISLYYEKLDEYKEKLSYAIGIMSEKILKLNGKDIVLTSLARAGTPIGILVKRYIKFKYNLDLKHYTISIIRDKGIDENAIKYILKNNPNKKIQFIDGWTGKGTISNELYKSCISFYKKYNIFLSSNLAVLADPGGYSNLYGIREDFLIPSACLNSTISGLISRTVLRDDLIGKDEFHGAKYYKNLIDKDESIKYIEYISNGFKSVNKSVNNYMQNWKSDIITKLGDEDVKYIKEEYDIKDINFIKPGIGETTRVLLRRIPYKILVKDISDKNINHILMLAKEKNVIVEEVNLKAYICCGIIKNLGDA